MRRWIHTAHVAAATCLLLLSGCTFTSKSDHIDVQDPVGSTALLLSDWHPGNAFVIDGPERFLVTCAGVGGNKAGTEYDVVFPVIENGKALVNRDKLKKAPRVKARLLYPDLDRRDPDVLRDVAVLQLAEPPPEGVPLLKLAAAEPARDATVSLLTTGPKTNLTWSHSSATVQDAAPRKASFPDKARHIAARMFELNLDGKLAKGVNGGPVVNDKNELVGVVASEPVQGDKLQCVALSEVRAALGGAYRQLAVQASDEGRKLLDQAKGDKAKAPEAMKKFDEAVAYCNKALEVSPNDARTYNERGATYSFKDQYDKAVADYTQALKLDPQLALAYRNRGSAYLHLKEYQKAVDDCTEALKRTNNQYPMALYTRSLAYEKMNKNAEASQDKKVLKELSEPRYVMVSRTGGTEYKAPEPPAYSKPAYTGPAVHC